MNARSDDELVAGFQNGDETCFNELVYRYKNILYQYILVMVRDEGAADGDAAQAEDDASGSATQSASEYEVTIDSASMTTDYEDNPALVVNYTWTNNSDEATSFAVAFDETCFQNGVERGMAIVSDVDTSNYMNEVQPGSSAEVTLCYELEDESEVTVEVKELFNLDDTVLAEKSFDPATL